MDVVEAVRKRKSIRAYKPDPVPRETLQEILEVATRAPSSMNTQPWHIHVVTGEVLENIKKGNIEALMSGKMPAKDVPYKPYEGVYKQRQVDIAKELFSILGIAREDKEKRNAWATQGFQFFGAPVAIIVAVEDSTDQPTAFSDSGGLVQTICLTAMQYGLGTCIMGQGIMFPDVVRRHTGIPQSQQMWICVTIGYSDQDAAPNKLQTVREPLENNTFWYGFD